MAVQFVGMLMDRSDRRLVRNTFRRSKVVYHITYHALPRSMIRPVRHTARDTQMTDVLVQCESMREAFRHWHAEQESLEEQLSESLAALSAYQSHLDAWQERLARERNELSEARAQWERERAAVEAEIDQSRAKARELASALDEQKQILECERSNWAQELEQLRAGGAAPQISAEPVTLAAPRAPKTMTESPVLGSIMEQFGKLRQQRASDRQALKKTTR